MKNKSFQTALCGIFTALQVAVMFLFSLTSIGTYAGPMAASFMLVPVLQECGKKKALLVYAASTFLTLILVPDKTLGLFSLMFGWYPVALVSINKSIKGKLLRSLVKLAICYTIVPLELLIEVKILGIPTGFEDVSSWIIWVIAVLGGVCFLLLDIIYVTVSYIWTNRIRKHIK